MSRKYRSSSPQHAQAAHGRILIYSGITLLITTVIAALIFTGRVIAYDATGQIQSDRDEQIAATYSQQLKSAKFTAAKKYNQSLAHHPLTGSLDLDRNYMGTRHYQSLLNAPNSVMATLRIPKIGVNLPVYHGASKTVLEEGLGHLPGTALPIGGAGNRPVIVGHRGLPGKTLFTRLNELTQGDLIYITVLGKTLAYRVTVSTTVSPSNLTAIRPQHDKDLLTLLTCTPYGVNTQRLLVTGERIPYQTNTLPHIPNTWQWIPPTISGIIVTTACPIIGHIFRIRPQGLHILIGHKKHQ